MLENVTQIKSGMMINVNVSVKIQKKIMCAKNIKSGTLQHVVPKIVNI